MPTIDRTPSPLPLIWLDTWLINDLARYRAGLTSGADGEAMSRLYNVLIRLRDAAGAICPESGQLVEVEAGRLRVKEAKSVLSQVSGGVKTNHLIGLQQQVYRGMRSFVEGRETIEMSYRDLFTDDPVRELRDRDLLIRVDFPMTDADLADIRAANLQTAENMEQLRKSGLDSGLSTPARIAAQVKRELNGIIEATLDLIQRVGVPLMSGVEPPPSMDDVLLYLDVVGRPNSVLAGMLQETRGEHGFWDDLIEFYRSDYYRTLPTIGVIAELYAWKIVGNETIKPSDVMDINQIAAFLPYATYMVLDNAMADKVRKARLDERFGCRVITWRELPQLVTELEDLVVSAPAVARLPVDRT